MTQTCVQCDEDYFSGVFRNLCSMFKVTRFILRKCINMAKIIVRHEMFNIKRGSFITSVQFDSFHCINSDPMVRDLFFKHGDEGR